MTFDTLSMRSTGIGDGVAVAFPFAFLVTDAADLIVFKIVDATVVRTNFVLGVDYTVTGLNVDTGGTVTLTIALPTGETLHIQRRPEVTQKVDIKNQGPFKALRHEKTYDRSRFIDQRLQDDVERSLRLPQEEVPSAVLTIIPGLLARKGKIIRFNAVTGEVEVASTGVAPAEIMWQIRGNVSLGDNPFPPYRAREAITITKFDIAAIGAGVGGNSILNLKKNGAIVAVITMAAGLFQDTEDFAFNVSMTDTDILVPEWASIAPTTPQSNVSIFARV